MAKPKTLDECMQAFTEMFSIEEQAKFLKMTKDEVGMMHHGLGQWIRNNWDLWKGGPLLEHMKGLGFIHQDDMSHAILVEYWNRMNNQPSEIAEQVQQYKEYWEKQ